MSYLLATARKDLRRRLNDPVALLIWFGIPLVIGGLMALVAGGDGGGVPRPRVLVADLDDTFLSGAIAGSGGEALGDFIELEEVELSRGRALLDAGDATALLIIPEGFSDAVLYEEPAELVLVENPAQQILPQIVRQGVELLVEAAFYAQRLLGPELRQLAAGPPAGQTLFADSAVAALSVAVNTKLASLQGIVLPPVLELEEQLEAGDGGGGFNFGRLFVPGLIFMALLFIAQGVSDDIWEEKDQGTLRRALVTPRSASAFLAGKLGAGGILVFGAALVGLAVVVAFYGVEVVRAPLALIWATLAGTALVCYLVLIQMFATSRRGGNLLTTMIIFPLLMVGGSFFPFEAMPGWMVAIGRWTPNGLAVLRLKDLLLGDIDPLTLTAAAAGILVPAFIAFFIAARRLRGGFGVS